MNKKRIFLIAGILALITFIGYLGETEPQRLFGYSVSIWVYRIAWLFLTISCFLNYSRLKKSEKDST
jgi:hypothetical protein